MPSKSYFKSPNGRLFFFVDSVPESLEAAWNEATAEGVLPSIYRPARFAGPWDAAPVIGYRSRADVLRDLTSETDEEIVANLVDELAAIEETYAAAHRPVPLQMVAA